VLQPGAPQRPAFLFRHARGAGTIRYARVSPPWEAAELPAARSKTQV